MRYLTVFIAIILFGCSSPERRTNADPVEWISWRSERVENLKSPNGFLNLAGLYWLAEGENTFGSDAGADIVFPEALPGQMGVLTWLGDQVWASKLHPEVLVDSARMESGLVYHRDSTRNAAFTYGSFVWYIIERAGNIGIRLKDLDHPKLRADLDISYFAYNPDLVVEAQFVPYLTPKKLSIDNVLGHQYEMDISGQLKFEIKGQIHTLEPMDEGDAFFIIFSDETSAISTYGSGRYMYARRPVNGEKVILDFNKSYNPPCAFTDFATCLIPPPENRLNIRIEAGELDFHF